MLEYKELQTNRNETKRFGHFHEFGEGNIIKAKIGKVFFKHN